MKTKNKADRVKLANELLNMIGRLGRHYFYNKDENAMSIFVIRGRNKRLWFIDKLGFLVNPYESNISNDTGFSEGGTLWSLVHDMREYILTVKATNGNHGYSGLLGEGWGYSQEEMQEIIGFAEQIGFIDRAEINA
ncbi:hypothetical protein CHH91_04490 [Virgibacillus sp. 7505]|uniref:hypothetical protein n=1 Tax=Virgibacillus sp. 7505 TaxID=2022548 RepID=UPI000BA555EE|nr:hypothetical protein [Virgibacillus sp. 7505]PAE17270.1 hypothetical protein CHH91_04490 [Virgibacillus sp. 7505]